MNEVFTTCLKAKQSAVACFLAAWKRNLVFSRHTRYCTREDCFTFQSLWFGCVCYVFVPDQLRTKLEKKARSAWVRWAEERVEMYWSHHQESIRLAACCLWWGIIMVVYRECSVARLGEFRHEYASAVTRASGKGLLFCLSFWFIGFWCLCGFRFLFGRNRRICCW